MEGRRVKGPKRTALPYGSVSDFMGVGLASRWSLANHSFMVNSGGMRHSAKMDSSKKDSTRSIRHI